jgi:hypothetical protein
VGFGAISKRVAAVPANIELRRLERLYGAVAERVNEVAANPSQRLVNEREYRTIDSTVVFDAGVCATLAARGFDVRSLALGKRQTGWVPTRKESTSTIENGIILGFLCLLADRFRHCALRAERQAQVLAEIKPYRERADGSTPLFDSEELPRIRRLEAIRNEAQRLGAKVSGMRKLKLFLGCFPRYHLRMTPVFRHVPAYNVLFRLIRDFLQRDQWLLEEGSEERIKLTSRLYEQWVYLQIVAAFRFCGLVGDAYEGLFRQLAESRFTLDLDSGTAVIFRCPDGQLVRVRCEPFILPLDLAMKQNEAVYDARRERLGFPHPDVVIEFIDGTAADSVPKVVFAITVDAKYKTRLHPEDWIKTQKYLKVNSVLTRRPVMRQLWLAFPSASGVRADDEDVEWGRPADPWRRDEELRGTIGMLPPSQPRDSESDAFRLCEGAIDFVSGLLTFYKGHNKLWDDAREQIVNRRE